MAEATFSDNTLADNRCKTQVCNRMIFPFKSNISITESYMSKLFELAFLIPPHLLGRARYIWHTDGREYSLLKDKKIPLVGV